MWTGVSEIVFFFLFCVFLVPVDCRWWGMVQKSYLDSECLAEFVGPLQRSPKQCLLELFLALNHVLVLGHVDNVGMQAGPKETAPWTFSLGGFTFYVLTYSSLLWDLSSCCISQRDSRYLVCEQLIEEKPVSFVSKREWQRIPPAPPPTSPREVEWGKERTGGGKWKSPSG